MLSDSQEVSISLYNKVERPKGLIVAWSISLCVLCLFNLPIHEPALHRPIGRAMNVITLLYGLTLPHSKLRLAS